jgi:hypothetical protein
MPRQIPECLPAEDAIPETMRCIVDAVSASQMDLQVKSTPMLVHWLMFDSLALANQRTGMGSMRTRWR